MQENVYLEKNPHAIKEGMHLGIRVIAILQKKKQGAIHRKYCRKCPPLVIYMWDHPTSGNGSRGRRGGASPRVAADW